MRWVKKTRVKNSTEFFDWQIQSTKSSFSSGSPTRNTWWKKVESKKLFFDCARKPDLGFSRKRPFSTDKSDCVRNGLIVSSLFSSRLFFWRNASRLSDTWYLIKYNIP